MSVTCTTHAHGQNFGEPQLKGSCGMRKVNGSLVFKHNLIKKMFENREWTKLA